MRKLYICIILIFLIVGCSNNQQDKNSSSGNPSTEMFNNPNGVKIDLENAKIVFYPGLSSNYSVMFNLVSNEPIDEDNFEINVDGDLNLTYSIYNSEMLSVEYKDFLVSKSFNWEVFKQGYTSEDLELNTKSQELFNSYEKEYEDFLNKISEVPNLYQVVLNFENPKIGDLVTKIHIKINGELYTFEIGEIAFLEYNLKVNEDLEGPINGTIGRKTYPKNYKDFTDDSGSSGYDFKAHTDIVINSIEPEYNTPQINSTTLRLLRNGFESTIVLDSITNIDFQIYEGDLFSLIPSYSTKSPNRQLIYAQTYNSTVYFEKNATMYNYLIESGVVNTEHTLASLLSSDIDKYETYYFEFLESIEIFDRNRG